MSPVLLRGICLAISLACTACAPKIVPVQTATALFNPADNSLTESHDGVAVSARINTLSVQPAQLNENLTAFHVVIDNQTDRQITIASENFVLRNGQSAQFRAVTPEKVMEIVSRDTVYLIPYPYVGYYYLEDQAQGAARQAMASSLPFYAEYHPQDIYTQSLPAGPVLPRSKISGIVYFLADLTLFDRAELLVFSGPALQGEPRYRFPFVVEK